MSNLLPSPLLRQALLADAVISGASALLMLGGAGLLTGLLGLPPTLLRAAGLVLLPYVAFVGWLGTRPAMPSLAVWAVVTLNGLWAVGCLELMLTGSVAPTSLGVAFLLIQAVTVLVFSALQYVGLMRSRSAAA
jgi:hypothetical protein